MAAAAAGREGNAGLSEEIPEQLADEAAELIQAFYFNFVDWEYVVGWADKWIMQLNRIPDDLLDVSSSIRNSKKDIDALSKISDMSAGGTVWASLKSHWRDAYLTGDRDELVIADQVWIMRDLVDYGSESWMSIMRLNHFSEEVTGVYMLTTEHRLEAFDRLRQEVLSFLEID